MKLSGRLVKNGKTIKDAVVERLDDNVQYRDMLEVCFLELCKELDIQVPLWFKKNTVELGAFHKTSFNSEHFMEQILFDRFEIHLG